MHFVLLLVRCAVTETVLSAPRTPDQEVAPSNLHEYHAWLHRLVEQLKMPASLYSDVNTGRFRNWSITMQSKSALLGLARQLEDIVDRKVYGDLS